MRPDSDWTCPICGGLVLGDEDDVKLCDTCGLPWASGDQPCVLAGSALDSMDLGLLRKLEAKLASGELRGTHVDFTVLYEAMDS